MIHFSDSPAYSALRKQQAKVVKVRVSLGADVTARNLEGSEPGPFSADGYRKFPILPTFCRE